MHAELALSFIVADFNRNNLPLYKSHVEYQIYEAYARKPTCFI